MILTAHQPVYLPWLGLFHKIALADVFCYFEDVQYQAKDWNNRNRIKFSNDKADWLTVPVLRKDYFKRSFLDVKINNQFPWRRKHWRSIESNYSKAPYFDPYCDELKAIYDREWNYLVDLNYEMLLLFLGWLQIKTKIVRMRDYEFKGVKNDLVLDMCKQLGASIYIFGAQGRNYADIDSFHQNQIVPYFQDYRYPAYKQFRGEFTPFLSIVDLLFNEGHRSLEIIMSGNVKKEDILKGEKIL